MKALMFGWEFPPHILGGLGTASYGLTYGLAQQGDMDIVFVLPRPWGDEEQSFLRIIGANSVDVPGRGRIEFSGRYPDNLLEEISNYEQVAAVLARQEQFDVIHSHDWLTYPAGATAKRLSGKPLVIHVHATDFDRSRGQVNPTVYAIERQGMDMADHIMCVSNLTRQTVIDKYGQNPDKVSTVHNAVFPLANPDEFKHHKRKDHLVTFLGRITMQKGPEYFVEAAARVLQRTNNVRFVMAGSGDKMNEMIDLAARRGISTRFHFPGFMRGKQVQQLLADSDVYIMPSVSEPFGISPLEAMQVGCPTIISHQSGCAEILQHAIKTDYWDIDAMADAIYAIVTNPALYKSLSEEGRCEVNNIRWEDAGKKVRAVYDLVTGR
jgi:glycosyltransferase involved in cell wall biosynthesis